MTFDPSNPGSWKVNLKNLLPEVEYPKMKTIDITTKQIKEMTDEEIKTLLTGEHGKEGIIPIPTQIALSNELTARAIHKASKPNWYIKVGFYVALITLFVAGLAAYFTVFPRSSQSSAAVQLSPELKQTVQNAVSSSHKQLSHSQPKPNNNKQK